MWKTRARIKGVVGKNLKATNPKCWIASKSDMEIWNVNVKCGGFSKYMAIKSKVTIGYA
jgi:hypothetical protein